MKVFSSSQSVIFVSNSKIENVFGKFCLTLDHTEKVVIIIFNIFCSMKFATRGSA